MKSVATLTSGDRKKLRELLSALEEDSNYLGCVDLLSLLTRLGEEPPREPKGKKGPSISQIHVALVDAEAALHGRIIMSASYRYQVGRCLLRARELLMGDEPVVSGDVQCRSDDLSGLLSPPEPRTKPTPSQIMLTGRQILALARFAIPCMVVDLNRDAPVNSTNTDLAPMLEEFDTQLNSDVVVCCGDEEGHHLAWLADYPDEGSVPLDPTEPVVMQFKWLPEAAETYKHLAARKGQKESNDD